MNLTELFRRLGLNTPRWQWRATRWERAMHRFLRGELPASGIRVSRALIGANIVFFVLMLLQGLLAGLGLRPLFSPDGYLLIHMGAQYWPLVLAENEWWRCLSYAFVHGGVLHLAFNMVVLYQVGPLVESEIGPMRFLTLYTLAALTGSLADYFWHPMAPVVGSSSALFGLIGFAVIHYHRLGDNLSLQRRNFMLQWAVFAFVFGLLVGADNAGHLGGAAGGVLFGLLLPKSWQLRKATDKVFRLLGGLSLLLLAGSLLLTAASWFIDRGAA
ncbi:rhomboid protease GluP [Geothermobacter ehrlichii]|uniref:Rhomboid protease GluP n=1 Tax=Geothermobacter ehrlichii TaxID=213224 RepID=A0A5D3WQ00_9BACT|nr:rhomboid family intramembrane serine protease [Geothermobacter ehrlichii]TYO99879.1 rhomboid protease GluP [Geothermobacter ehrlichii]